MNEIRSFFALVRFHSFIFIHPPQVTHSIDLRVKNNSTNNNIIVTKTNWNKNEIINNFIVYIGEVRIKKIIIKFHHYNIYLTRVRHHIVWQRILITSCIDSLLLYAIQLLDLCTQKNAQLSTLNYLYTAWAYQCPWELGNRTHNQWFIKVRSLQVTRNGRIW